MLPDGCIVTLITPFTKEDAIDYDAIDVIVDWHLASGTVGFFTPCLSSEMFALSNAERLALATHVKKRVGSRAVVVATGTYGGSIEEQAAFCNEIATCCDAVVVNTATLVPQAADEAAWKAAATRLLELTGSIQLGLYECPVPHKRLLSPALIGWCARTGRFHFHKDTSCSMEAIRAKLDAIGKGTPFKFYNANVETLLPSLRAGAHGFSGIGANFYPHLHAWLCHAAANAPPSPAKKRPRSTGNDVCVAMERVQDFLALAEGTVVIRYPQSAKEYLKEWASGAGGPAAATDPTAPPPVLDPACRHKPDGTAMGAYAPMLEHQHVALGAMWRMQHELSEALGIKMAPPPARG